jgi:L-cysteate sulfo-lyase
VIERLLELPRVRLAQLPTPLEPLDRFSEWLGGPRIWLKRDDCTGLATGGNKTRKLEFLLGAAEQEGADVVITFGAVQSNHARQTAAACAARGLACHLLLARKVPWRDPNYERLGNVLLDRLFGADVQLLAPEAVAGARDALLDRLGAAGQRAYLIPVGGSNPIGALGYAVCAQELLEQAAANGFALTDVVHATSSAGTQAGLLGGLALLACLDRVRVRGINVSEPPPAAAELAATVLELAREAAALCGHEADIPATVLDIDSAYLGDGYGLPTEATLDAIRALAVREGVLLDPVYSGKAMSGLIGKIRRGELDGVSDVVFIHTGGTASLPVYGQVLTATPA